MFIEQAYLGKNTWWRLLITTICTVGIFIGNFVFYFSLSQKEIDSIYQSMQNVPKNNALIMNLFPFIFLLGLLFLLVRNLHHRSILSLTTSREKVDFKRILFSFSLVVFFTIIAFILSYYNDNSAIVWNFDASKFFILLLISSLFFPFQIGFEEYVFRGYLMQQIGIITKNRWFPLVLTSVIFGLFHAANPEVAKLGFGVMVFYIGTGLLLGIITLMDDGLELALGFHLGNNMMAALLITSSFSAVQTDAVFIYSGSENTNSILNEMILSIAIVYPIILYIFARQYKWTDWKSKLTGTIIPKKQTYETDQN